MRHVSLVFAAAIVAIVVWAPTTASASPSPTTTLSSSVTAPSPTTPPTGPSTGAPIPTQVVPTAEESNTVADALTIVGFTVVAMAGLVLLIRAGLRSAGAEDDDAS